jgi:hypothetical protein
VRQNALVMDVHVPDLDVGLHGRASKLSPEAYIGDFAKSRKQPLLAKKCPGRDNDRWLKSAV